MYRDPKIALLIGIDAAKSGCRGVFFLILLQLAGQGAARDSQLTGGFLAVSAGFAQSVENGLALHVAKAALKWLRLRGGG